MYKITLYDANCSPICDGLACWYVDDLKEFEENWIPLQSRTDVEVIEKYYRSKFGEVVTAWYSDDPDLNIVQEIDAEIIAEKQYRYTNKDVELTNAYAFTTRVEFDELVTSLRLVRIGDKRLLLAQYEGHGCKKIDPVWTKESDGEDKYSTMSFYGNPIANCYFREDYRAYKYEHPDYYKGLLTHEKEFFKDDSVKTFVWIPIKEVSEKYRIRALSRKELSLLLMDIVGEAG